MSVTFIKLGGSLITDKRQERTYRPIEAARIATEIARAKADDPTMRLLIGHGSGSFGHVTAKQFNTVAGVHTVEEWHGFAAVATVAAALNALVAETLTAQGLPVWRMSPSASAVARDGQLIHMALDPIRAALEHDLIPLVHGDVALDEVRGGTIVSTETVFFYLSQHIPVSRILLVGEVDGVYDATGNTIPLITPETLPQVEEALGGSAGTDVTGGMETKVRDMVALVIALPHLHIRILNGKQENVLYETLLGSQEYGTAIRANR